MDFASNFIAAVAPLIFVLLVGGGFWLGVRLQFRAFGLTLLLAPVAALGMAADHLLDSGHPLTTPVIVKEEQIVPTTNAGLPDAAGRFVLQVRLPDGAIAPVETDSADFDALSEGDEIGIVEYAQGPLRWNWAANIDRRLWLIERLHGELAWLAGAGLWLSAVLAMASFASLLLRRPHPALLVATIGVGALSAGCALAAWGEDLRAFDQRASATVVEAARISEHSVGHWLDGGISRVPLVSPYYEVRVRFTPEGGRDGVTFIDRIDADGAPPVAGERLNVDYSSRYPRHAELTDRGRSFANANQLAAMLDAATYLTGGLAALIGLLSLVWAFARQRARGRLQAAGAGRRGAKTNF